MNMTKLHILPAVAAACFLAMIGSCDDRELAELGKTPVPEGMVEVRPVLPGMYSSIPRTVSGGRSVASRTYDPNDKTNARLDTNKLVRLPSGSTVWLIAKTVNDGQAKPVYVKKSYVVYNPDDNEDMSYLVPCTVDDDGKMMSMQGTPLYLKDGSTYDFYAISPARRINQDSLAEGVVGFQVRNGEYFYANDCRYEATTPDSIVVKNDNNEDVQIVKLKPMIHQSAQLKFRIRRGKGVHNLDIQPSGIQISGLQNDAPDAELDGDVKNPYGNPNGLYWHMSQDKDDEPMILQHGGKSGTFNCYDYVLRDSTVYIDVPILPMRSLSKPVIVLFRLKINGVPTTYEMMLNEKDFKAGYSYGYSGSVSIEDGVTVVTWQFVQWETDVILPDPPAEDKYIY